MEGGGHRRRHGRARGNDYRKDAPEDLLTEEEVELLTSPLDLAAYKSAITEAMFRGTKRNVESEESGSGGGGPKNGSVG